MRYLMPYRPNAFLRDESGAVTVDWVVLTAALVGLGIAVTIVIRPAIIGPSGKINEALEQERVFTTFTEAAAQDAARRATEEPDTDD
ncbi:MAG: pilus assembly protein [Pseudomonadota bacterium]